MDKLDKAVRALVDGRSDRERVEEFGGHPSLYTTARSALRLLGADIPERGQKCDHDARMALLVQGVPIKKVAEAEGVSRQAIYNYWERHATFDQKRSRRLAQEKSQLASSES